ncbi:Protein CBG06358 [Caenorhabditis briggsae]|uniref:Protein CBG06358 n=1 Tax=Caenorhabditis briggsae TaxID=6238 RepID=A8X221_CAEBR|nr:Protein CBG06358 [Caenorhabditis briggsae]CAP26681.2 Protein CBG06358 [Caenorhabditis briggsae]
MLIFKQPHILWPNFRDMSLETWIAKLLQQSSPMSLPRSLQKLTLVSMPQLQLSLMYRLNFLLKLKEVLMLTFKQPLRSSLNLLLSFPHKLTEASNHLLN